ncbi:MAG TPA: alpha/beta fold hydrolase, partial [Longimicrobiales bacterium]|nr:alpha/beta fold hydrolase [Longimicrobiales bacterium]
MIRKTFVVVVGAVVLASAVVLQALQRTAPDARAAASTTDAANIQFDRVRLSTGVELQVAERGPADGTPVLYLHGYTDSWFSFSLSLNELPSHIRAIVPTQRGHGESDKPDCCYLLADFARDAVALLDALGIERADVV